MDRRDFRLNYSLKISGTSYSRLDYYLDQFINDKVLEFLKGMANEDEKLEIEIKKIP